MPDLAVIYTALFAQGLLWSAGHCAGMCGPLMLAFRFGADESGQVRAGAALLQLAAYQTGRALVYAGAGAAAGLAGSGISRFLASPWISLGLAAWCLVMAVIEAGWLRLPNLPPMPGAARVLALRSGMGRGFVLGLVMAFLPCAVVVWALGLAAATTSPLHGALVLAGLVLVTTPVLALCVVLPAGLGHWRIAVGRRLVPAGLALAGVWIGVVAVRTLLAGGPACVVGHGG
jgi:hypothetical protein